MTALRVVTDHTELSSVGTLSHGDIDSLISGSLLVTVPGVTGTRVLRAGTNVSITTDSQYVTISSVGGSGGGSGGSFALMETPQGIIDGSNNVFQLSSTPVPSISLMLFENGILQTQGQDYALSGSVVSFTQPPNLNCNLNASYPRGGFSWMEKPAGEIDGINANLTLQFSPSPQQSLMLFVNGVLQTQGSTADYSLSDMSIILNTPPNSGSNVNASYPY